MSTPIILVGTLPGVTTGADTVSHGPHDPASIDQNMANLRAAADGKMPLAGTAGVVSFGSVSVSGSISSGGTIEQGLSGSVNPSANTYMCFNYVTDTQLKIKVRGSDGVVRSFLLTLS